MRKTKELPEPSLPEPCLRERLLSEAAPTSEVPAKRNTNKRDTNELPEPYLRERLLSVAQTAQLFGVSPSSVRRMIRRGEVGPLIRIGLRRQGLRAGPLLDAVKRRERAAEVAA
jgi:hypothetical protein